MSYKHEPRQRPPAGLCLSNQKNRHRLACMRYPDQKRNEVNFTIYAKVWIGEGESNSWFTQGWIELWPKTPLIASTFAEANRLLEEFSEQLVASIDEQLYTKIYPTTTFVETVEHSSKKFLARIYRREDEKFTIDYCKWSESRGGELWVTTRRSFGTLTVADDLESAREAARLELDEFAAGVYT